MGSNIFRTATISDIMNLSYHEQKYLVKLWFYEDGNCISRNVASREIFVHEETNLLHYEH